MKIDAKIAILKQDFLEEALEMIEECEQLFLGLEENPKENTDHIDQIFRLAHTIKGSGLAAGFQELSDFSHDFESLLSKVGAGEIEVSKEIIDLLLQSNDALKEFLLGLLKDYKFILDTSELQDKIGHLIGQENAVANKDLPSEKYGFFKLPTKKPKGKKADQITDSFPDTEISNGNISILVCDDDTHLLEVLADSIEKSLGIEVVRATNGRLALETINASGEKVISAVVTDLKMPEMNGLEFIRELRKTDPDLPVIFYSGYAEMEDLKEFIKLGAYAFLPKPFKKDLMVLEINKALKSAEIQDNIFRLAELNFNTYIKLARWSAKMIKSDRSYEKLEKDVLGNLKRIQEITFRLVNKK